MFLRPALRAYLTWRSVNDIDSVSHSAPNRSRLLRLGRGAPDSGPTMNLLDLTKLIGREGSLGNGDGLTVLVTVTSVKVCYGRPRLLVSPLSGSGQVWVDASRVQFTEEVF